MLPVPDVRACPKRQPHQAAPCCLRCHDSAYPATMITAVHTMVYADDADAARAFFRDVLGWAHVDAHGGWLIFRTGPVRTRGTPDLR